MQRLSTSRHKGEDPRSHTVVHTLLFCHVSKECPVNYCVSKQVFLQSNRQAKFTPRAIARIMHGVGSPAFPNSVWSKTHFWYIHHHQLNQAMQVIVWWWYMWFNWNMALQGKVYERRLPSDNGSGTNRVVQFCWQERSFSYI